VRLPEAAGEEVDPSGGTLWPIDGSVVAAGAASAGGGVVMGNLSRSNGVR